MSYDVARTFHDATKHTWRSVRTDRHPVDWARQPIPYKLYTDLEPIPLTIDLAESDWPAVDALAGASPPAGPWADDSWLASFLFYAAGITRRWEAERGMNFRAAPSAGALYPIEVYVVCRDLGLDELPAGVYHFEPYEFALRQLREGDHRSYLAQAAATDAVESAPASLVFTGIPWRATWKYGTRGYRHLFWDLGTMLANLLAVAVGNRVPTSIVTGFIDEAVARLVGVDMLNESPLAVVPLGEEAERAPLVGTQLEPITYRTSPDPRGFGEDAEVDRVHLAGVLETEDDVWTWREEMRALRLGVTTKVEPPTSLRYDTIESVILQRGSTRRFGHGRAPLESLVWPMSVANQSIAIDAVADNDSLLQHLLVVHGVEDLAPGAYRWTPQGPDLLRPGSFRGEAATLCLEQELGGDGAYTVFHTADLDRVLHAGGARGYRVAQLEGGIAAGRLQLAAFAMDLGGTGLTFYDDDVPRFFDVEVEPMTVSSIGRPGYQPRVGSRPSGAMPGRLLRPEH